MEIRTTGMAGYAVNAIFILVLVFLFMYLAATGKWQKILDVVKNPPP